MRQEVFAFRQVWLPIGGFDAADAAGPVSAHSGCEIDEVLRPLMTTACALAVPNVPLLSRVRSIQG
eukprot:6199120-Pleurochrysis_carterae.AAC.4